MADWENHLDDARQMVEEHLKEKEAKAQEELRNGGLGKQVAERLQPMKKKAYYFKD